MNTYREIAEYLIARIQMIRGTDTEQGALSLEWIVIATLLVAAAGAAGIIFRKAITDAAASLP